MEEFGGIPIAKQLIYNKYDWRRTVRDCFNKTNWLHICYVFPYRVILYSVIAWS